MPIISNRMAKKPYPWRSLINKEQVIYYDKPLPGKIND
jgi:hypothetical protein